MTKQKPGSSSNCSVIIPIFRRIQATGEANLLAKLSHPNIVRYWEGFFDGLVLCMVMDYAEGGDLRSHLEARSQGFSLLYIDEEQVLGWYVWDQIGWAGRLGDVCDCSFRSRGQEVPFPTSGRWGVPADTTRAWSFNSAASCMSV